MKIIPTDDPNIVLMSWKGESKLDAGYIYCPYIPKSFRKGETEMLDRAYQSLLSLSVGDAFGENALKSMPPGSVWYWTDDTAMARMIYKNLCDCGQIDPNLLAKLFAESYYADPNRGYGRGTAKLLFDIRSGGNWLELSRGIWDGKGSHGNGGAMRSAVIGAYYGRDYESIVRATTSATETTHANKDAIDGAIAIAIAAGYASTTKFDFDEFYQTILQYTPDGPVRERIATTIELRYKDFPEVGGIVGSGYEVSALDTVPYAIWCAAYALSRNPYSETTYEYVMERIAFTGGDTDTVCAMVGGIVGNVMPPPKEMVDRTESLNL